MSFIYVGRLDELKGTKLLFEAWKLMGDNAPELKVCGTGMLENWCREFIDRHCLSMVSKRGSVQNAEVKKLMAESEALILPTQWYEGFPMSIVEAFSVGTPVICSDLGNAGSIVEEDVTGWKFKADSPEDLVRAVQKTTDIRESVKRVYKQKYTSAENYRELVGIYSNVSGQMGERECV